MFFISGAIYGAVDPDSKRGIIHAYKAYESFINDRFDIRNIYSNLCLYFKDNKEFSISKISEIKDYLILEPHFINNKLVRFDPHCSIAHSWERLKDRNSLKILPHDITLLRHEYIELCLYKHGVPQDIAHNEANKVANYTEESDIFYSNFKFTEIDNYTEKQLFDIIKFYDEKFWEHYRERHNLDSLIL